VWLSAPTESAVTYGELRPFARRRWGLVVPIGAPGLVPLAPLAALGVIVQLQVERDDVDTAVAAVLADLSR
jgi:hypothetical protein